VASLLLAGAGGCGGIPGSPHESGSRVEMAPALVVLISVGGLGTTEILGPPGTDADAARVAMPRLAAMAARGVVAERVETVAPATPLPVHATLVTGRLPSHHGVTGELPLTPRGVRLATSAAAAVPRGRTLWTAATEHRLRVGALGWPGTSAAAAQLFAHFPAASNASPERWPRELAEHTTPTLLEAARGAAAESLEVASEGAARDRVLIDLACDLAGRSDPPQLLLVRLGGPLPALVREGPASPAARDAFARVDREIERAQRCLERGALRGRVAFFVVGDAVYSNLHTVISPNAVLADAGLLVPAPNATVQLLRWSAFARPSGALALVHARTEDDAVLARRALDAAARSNSGFRIVGAEELIARGADSEAWFGLEAQPGFGFGLAVSGPLLRPATERGVAGTLDPLGGATPGFVASGAGIRASLRYPVLRQVDVAPTIARLLDLTLGEVDGRPLVGALVAGSASLRIEPASDLPIEPSKESP
jgi:hypothetical protein